jgi:hypothetical protein
MPRPKFPPEPSPPRPVLDPYRAELIRRIGNFLVLGHSLGDPRNADDRLFWFWIQLLIEEEGMPRTRPRGQGGFQFPRETHQAVADLEWSYTEEELKKPKRERRSMAKMAADYVHENEGRLKDPFATPQELLELWKHARKKPPAWWQKG